ncbi:MAG: hypothetical protein LBD37_00355, partial [Treponema sp.]|nr:hypothetical protein [Treponema sp.]
GNFQWAANPFEGREPVPALASEFASIDAVYAFLENYQGYGGGGQYTMVIRYNKEYHYPEYFSCSVIQPADAAGAGGRFGFEITNFEVLNK